MEAERDQSDDVACRPPLMILKFHFKLFVWMSEGREPMRGGVRNNTQPIDRIFNLERQ